MVISTIQCQWHGGFLKMQLGHHKPHCTCTFNKKSDCFAMKKELHHVALPFSWTFLLPNPLDVNNCVCRHTSSVACATIRNHQITSTSVAFVIILPSPHVSISAPNDSSNAAIDALTGMDLTAFLLCPICVFCKVLYLLQYPFSSP